MKHAPAKVTPIRAEPNYLMFTWLWHYVFIYSFSLGNWTENAESSFCSFPSHIWLHTLSPPDRRVTKRWAQSKVHWQLTCNLGSWVGTYFRVTKYLAKEYASARVQRLTNLRRILLHQNPTKLKLHYHGCLSMCNRMVHLHYEWMYLGIHIL